MRIPGQMVGPFTMCMIDITLPPPHLDDVEMVEDVPEIRGGTGWGLGEGGIGCKQTGEYKADFTCGQIGGYRGGANVPGEQNEAIT